MGDFNINLLNYDHHMETHDYVDTMFSNSATTATLIDNIYSNDILGEYNQLHGIFYTDMSDHLPIFLVTKLNNDIKDDVTIETSLLQYSLTSTIHLYNSA